MAFSKKKVDDRKEWLSSFVPGTFLDNSSSEITYTDFINRVRPAYVLSPGLCNTLAACPTVLPGGAI